MSKGNPPWIGVLWPIPSHPRQAVATRGHACRCREDDREGGSTSSSSLCEALSLLFWYSLHLPSRSGLYVSVQPLARCFFVQQPVDYRHRSHGLAVCVSPFLAGYGGSPWPCHLAHSGRRVIAVLLEFFPCARLRTFFPGVRNTRSFTADWQRPGRYPCVRSGRGVSLSWVRPSGVAVAPGRELLANGMAGHGNWRSRRDWVHRCQCSWDEFI